MGLFFFSFKAAEPQLSAKAVFAFLVEHKLFKFKCIFTFILSLRTHRMPLTGIL